MYSPWLPKDPEELERQASLLRRIAAQVYDRDVCERLKDRANALVDYSARLKL